MTSVDGASVIRPAGAGAGLGEQRAADLTAQIIDLTAASAARPAETIDLDRSSAEPPTTIEAAPSDPTTALRAALPVSARGRWRRRYPFVVALGDAGALLLAVILVVGFRPSTLRHVHGPVHRLVVVGGLLALWALVLAATKAYEGQRLFAGRCNLRRVMQAGATAGFLVAVGARLADRADLLSFVAFVVPLGVAFQIYQVMAWRAGKTNFLTSSLARAVLFSGLTTGVAFGALIISSHPGTASMGRRLLISLAFTLAAALFFGPALMGPPPPLKARAPEPTV